MMSSKAISRRAFKLRLPAMLLLSIGFFSYFGKGSNPGVKSIDLMRSSIATLGFDVLDCDAIYFDVGSNVGVQLRKLYEEELFPDAYIVKIFAGMFNHVERRNVCSIGFEPNPKHTQYLQQVESP